MDERVVPIEDRVESRDKKEASSHGGEDVHVFFGGVFVGIVGGGRCLLERFFCTDLGKSSCTKLLSIVVHNCFRNATLLDKGLQ